MNTINSISSDFVRNLLAKLSMDAHGAAGLAQEAGQLTRAQILERAGQSMLAQANALPDSVQQLLR